MAERGKCQVCCKSSESRCSWCRLIWYCCKEHQKQDWDSHKAACTKKKYSIEPDPTLGRHLVASEDIKSDRILLKDRPIVLSLKPNTLDFIPNKVCLGCYKEIKVDESESDDSSTSTDSSASGESSSSDGESKKNVCPKCQLPLCSPGCGTQHFHKTLECRLISEVVDPFTPEIKGDESGSINWKSAPSKAVNVRGTILEHLLYFRCILLKTFSPSSWDEMISLQPEDVDGQESHCDPIALQKTTRIYNLLKGILQHINHPLINQPYKPDVHKILWILERKSLNFHISADVELTGVFPTFSLLQHSCVPNVRFYLNPTGSKYVVELFCRSAIKIRKAEHLTVSHVNLCWNTEKRREFLRKEKNLGCNCVRCQDPTELGTNFSTIICPQETCQGYANPFTRSPLTSEMQWKCVKCAKIIPPWQVKKLDNKLCELVAKTKPNLQNYKKLIAKLDEVVHPDYYLSFAINHSLLQMFGDKESEDDTQDEDARTHNAQMLEDKVALCNRLLQIIKKLDPGHAKLNIYTAVIYYEMQSSILAMCGGEVDDDFNILRHKPETVKLAKLYLQKCMDSFKYELLDVPENKLKKLAQKKTEYLDFIILKFKK